MSKDKEPFRIGITMGDFNGVGMEVILKTFSDQRMFDRCIPVLYGSSKVFTYYKKLLGLQEPSYNIMKAPDGFQKHRINLNVVWDEEVEIKPGQDMPEAGQAALKALDAAIADLKNGHIDAMLTAPINKKNMLSDQFPFAGHTEYLAQQFNAPQHMMLMVSERIRIGLVTGHVPVSEISSKLNIGLIVEKLEVMNQSLINDFRINKPRIAVLGLNPHAGDGGVIGKEDRDIILPAINAAKEKDILAFGPYPSDGFFGNHQFEQFDAVLAMYHDQGLIPFKYLAFEDGVNYTAGLSYIRTSPDHGTAYDIAGKNSGF